MSTPDTAQPSNADFTWPPWGKSQAPPAPQKASVNSGRRFSTQTPGPKTPPPPSGTGESHNTTPLPEKNVTPEAPNTETAERSNELSKKILGSKSLKDLVDIASSFCPRRPVNEKLFALLAEATRRRVQEFDSNQIAELFNAFEDSFTREQYAPLFESLAKRAINIIVFFTPGQLASLSRAVVNFELNKELLDPNRHRNQPQIQTNPSFDMRTAFFDAVANAAINHRGIFSSRNLADLAFNVAKAGIRDTRLFNHLANKMMEPQRGKIPALDTFKSEQLWRTLWAFATLGIINQPLIDKLIARTVKVIGELDLKAIGNILWALAILGQRPDPKTAKILVDKFAGFNPSDMSLRQAFYFYQHTIIPHPDGNYPLEWPPVLVEKFNALKVGDVNISKLQAEVFAEVKKLHPDAIEEHPIRKMPVDIAIKKVVHGKKVKLAIEVDGRTHFAYKSQTPLGPTEFKRRLLNRKGWQVISVPYWDWDAIKRGDLQAMAAYLKSILPSMAAQNPSAEKTNPPMSKSAMKKARRSAQAASEKPKEVPPEFNSAASVAPDTPSTEKTQPPMSKSAKKRAKKVEAARQAAEAQQNQNVDTDDEEYLSFDESDEQSISGEFESAHSSNEEKQSTHTAESAPSSDNEDEGYTTASDE